MEKDIYLAVYFSYFRKLNYTYMSYSIEEIIDQLGTDSFKYHEIKVIGQTVIFPKKVNIYSNEGWECFKILNDRDVSIMMIFEDSVNCNFISGDRIDFSGSTFVSSVAIQGIDTHVFLNFSHCDFQDELFLTDCELYNRIVFRESVFQKFVFVNCCNFRQGALFSNCTFNSDVQISGSEFYRRIDFSSSIFVGQFQLLHNSSTDGSVFILEDCFFNSALDISRCGIVGNIDFFRVIIKQMPRYVSLYETDNLFGRNEDFHAIGYSRLRESFRIIKHYFHSNFDNIQSLRIYSFELESYRLEMLHYRKEGLRQEMNIGDYLILAFNSISTKHGTDPWLGVLFILLTGLATYCIFLLSISYNLQFKFSYSSIMETLRYYLQIINLTDWNFKPFGVQINTWGYLTLFFGRIFISYGYYQTIQAFRKFGKR